MTSPSHPTEPLKPQSAPSNLWVYFPLKPYRLTAQSELDPDMPQEEPGELPDTPEPLFEPLPEGGDPVAPETEEGE